MRFSAYLSGEGKFAAPVVRQAALKKYPQLREALEPLGGLLTDAVMQRLNYEVDEKKRLPSAVAHEFLVENRLIEDTAR